MDKDSKLTATTKGKAPEVLNKVDEKKVEVVKAETVKVEAKKVEAVKVEEKPVASKPEVKQEVKKEDAVIDKKAVEETKEVPKKTTPKKKAAKVSKTKASAKKKETVKKEISSKINVSTYIQYLGKEIEQNQLVEKVKANWMDQGNDAKAIKNLELYVKPEEGAVYYVVNGIPDSGKIDF